MNIIATGASRGIGLAILEKFAEAGWNIAFCSKNPQSVSKTLYHLQTTYPHIQIIAQTVDVSIKEEVISFGKKCLEEFKSIDILVNNAGKYTPGVISEANYDDDLENLMKVNLYSAYWLGKIIIPSMIEKQKGHIFNISSIAGLQAYHNGGSYAITKFAVQGYTRTLREELKSKKIRVTGLYPGATLTDSWAGTELPSSRFIAPKDIADIIFHTYSLTSSAVVEDIVIRPQEGDI